jgi:acyl-CoA thioester hydrolase
VSDSTVPSGRISIRVRYPETDRMGVAHHSHHLVWFELGRTEWLRDLGIPYSWIEDSEGIFLPVVKAGAEYHASARYDDRLLVTTRLGWLRRVRMRLEYEVRREDDQVLIATGFTVHAALGRDRRPCRMPDGLARRLGGTA